MRMLLVLEFVLRTVPLRRLPGPSGVAVGLGAVVAVGCGVAVAVTSGVAVASGVSVLSAVAVADEPLFANTPSSTGERRVSVLTPMAAAMPPMRIAPIIAMPTRLRNHPPIST